MFSRSRHAGVLSFSCSLVLSVLLVFCSYILIFEFGWLVITAPKVHAEDCEIVFVNLAPIRRIILQDVDFDLEDVDFE